MSKRNVEIINFVRDSAKKQIKQLREIKRTRKMLDTPGPEVKTANDPDPTVSDLVADFEKVVGYEESLDDSVSTVIDGKMGGYVTGAFEEYEALKKTMKNSVAHSVAMNLVCDKADVFAMIELMDVLHEFSGKKELDATEYANVEMYCASYFANPNDFYDMAMAPIKEAVEELKKAPSKK